MSIDLVASGIMLDDLVFPDGRTAMGIIGGGGPQTAFGMRLPALAGWNMRPYSVGIVSGVGADLPAGAYEWLDAVGIDRTGVRVTEYPTARAWQVMETDGQRTQVWRVPGPVIGAQLGHSLDRLPESYREARGWHLGIHPDEPDLDWIAQLHGLGSQPVISLEPFKPADHPLADSELRALVSVADIFSPNLEEARSLVGEGTPQELARRIHDAGAGIVTLRLGPEGSLVYDRHRHSPVHIPAVHTQMVDATGAGNAYCGAFLVGYLLTGDIVRSGRYGTVAASFLIEQIGLPPMTPQLPGEANRRLAEIGG